MLSSALPIPTTRVHAWLWMALPALFLAWALCVPHTAPMPKHATPLAPGTTLQGRALAISSDELLINGRQVRLAYIDGMEVLQSCMHQGKRHKRCGDIGRALLENHTAHAQTVCSVHHQDAWGRHVATCHADGADLAHLIVAQGYALSFPEATGPYADTQRQAEAQKAGVWAGYFMPPWDVRKGGEPT